MADTITKTITKTIKLKIVLPKNSDERKAIFDSHCALNEVACEYEKSFMLMRQEEYYDENRELVLKNNILSKFAKKFPKITSNEQKEVIKALFRNIAVDDGTGKTPSAQKIVQWNTLLFGTYKSGKGGRHASYNAKSTAKKDAFASLKDNCNKQNIFPLLTPVLTNNLAKSPSTPTNESKLSYWDKAAMRVAVSHLISWHECEKSTRANYKEQSNKVKKAKEELDKFDNSLIRKIDKYCKERKHENAGFETDKEFYITDKMCGGLTDIVKEWKNKDEAERLQVIDDWQSNNNKKRKIGDVNFFHWLLKDDNKAIYETKDFLDTTTKYHSELLKFKRMYNSARYTFPDRIKSPRWLMYEYKGGSNLKNYEILYNDKKLKLKLPLLLKNTSSKFGEDTYEFDLAKSKQFEVLKSDGKEVLKSDDKKVTFKTSNEEFSGKFGGADILVKLDDTGKSIKAAYLKISMKVDKKIFPKDFEKISSKVNYHFSTAYIQDKTKHSDEILAAIKNGCPIRAMSVDLGQRSFGACSVFQLMDEKSVQKGRFAIPAILSDTQNWLAVHERSFLVKLPGEDVSDNIISKRSKAMNEVETLKKEVNILKDILKIINQKDLTKKRKIIDQSKKYYENTTCEVVLKELSKLTTTDEINTKANELFNKHENELAHKIKTWRKESKAHMKRDYYGGKSMWMIEYITEIRTLLLRWSNHPSKAGKVMRQDKEKFGTVCKQLLKHINNLKEDRIKTGADLLIQSSRGFVYNEETHTWIEKFKPCNVIVLEDLSSYKFDTGKTKHENKSLMKWAHREILAQIKWQAQLYGISIYDSTDARYTSKFYAKTNAPGIRCKSLKKEDFEEGKLLDWQNRISDYTEAEINRLKIGDIIPFEGGELFATLDDGKLKIIHADINASWNLQRKFWGRHTDLLNLKTYLSDRQLYVKNDLNENKRLNGALKKTGFNNPKNVGLIKIQGGIYKITNDKNNTVEWSSDDGKYSPNLFRDISCEFYPNPKKDEFYSKKDFEKTVREKIIVNLKRSNE
jgi:IS605 OrfB family transposase